MKTFVIGLILTALSNLLAFADDQPQTGPLAHFRFNGNDRNEGSGDASLDLKNTDFENDALRINGEYEYSGRGDAYRAICVTPRLERTAFTVIARLKPEGLGQAKRNLITGGTSHRWLGLNRTDKGRLILTLNNQAFSKSIGDTTVEDGVWATIAAAVDLAARQVRILHNGKQVALVELPEDFEFKVAAGADNVWSFANYSNAGTFQGLVDELMIFNRALSSDELAKLPVVTQVQPDEAASGTASALAGEWKNTKPDGGITKITITQENESWEIQAWGQCSPVDCDWGRVDLRVLGNNVGDKSARYGFAHWDHQHSDVYMTVRIEQDQLLVETYDIFKDDSGRANYRSLAKLGKAQAAATQEPTKSDEVNELLKAFDSADGNGFYQAANQLETVLDAADQKATQVAEQLLTQLPSITHNSAEVAQLFAQLSADKKETEAGKLLLRVMQAARTVKSYKQGHVVVGQLVVEDAKTDPELVMAQMPIGSNGYFAGEVGDLKRPVCFRAHGYANLDVPLEGKTGDVVSVGKIVLKPLAAADQATFKGKVIVDGAADTAGASLQLSMSVGPINTPHNGYSPRRRWPEGIQVPIDKSGEFTVAGLSPSGYYVRISAADHVDKSSSLEFKAGETLDGGEFRLFSSDLGFYLGKAAPQATELAWESDFAIALKRAKEEEKPLLIMMTATWCGPCKLLDKETLHNPWVSSFLSPFVLLKAYEDREVEQKYGLGGYPTLVFADSDGDEAYKTVGYQPALKFSGECARAFKKLKLELPSDLQTLIEKKVVDAD